MNTTDSTASVAYTLASQDSGAENLTWEFAASEITTEGTTKAIGVYIAAGALTGKAAGDYTDTLSYGVTVEDAEAATDLATITADYTAQDGEILTGTLGATVKISIADGATVTLSNATINGSNGFNDEWAGITCNGSATIILEGTNTVKGFYENYPGIYVPSGKTLTIQGDGSLTASSNGWGAGIGGGYNISSGSCGNIVIEGGTITAIGGERGAGIGSGNNASGNSLCGDITITGGTIEATGGEDAAGIGSGYASSCGTITIANTVTSVKATKGDSATNSIGAGKNGSCTSVTIGGVVYWDGSAYHNGGDTILTNDTYEYKPNS